MFNRGETSAYGKGITSNLVSDEQRQRFNYGGRVGLYNGGNYTSFGQNPLLSRSLPSGTYDFDPGAQYKIDQLNLEDMYTRENLYPEWEKTWTVSDEGYPTFGHWNVRDILKPQLKAQERAMLRLKKEDPIQFEKEYEQWVKEKGYDKKRTKQEELFESAGITSDFLTDKPGLVSADTGASTFDGPDKEVEEPGYERGEHWEDLASKMPGDAIKEVVKDDTDQLDTPDKWAFLDENIAKKKKLAKGHAFMEGAAGAARWGTAATPEKRGAAIADTLSKMGTIGTKYTGEAEDIKTKAKILGTIEDIKGEHKLDVWKAKLEDYYKPSLDQAKEAQEWKEDRAEIADETKSGKEIYATILLPKEIRSPQDQQKAILSLTDQRLTIEDDKNSKELRDPGKDGLIFITNLGEIVKNNNGSIDPINPLTDPFFKWKN